MKLSEAIAVWDILHTRDTGDVGYFDLQEALEQVLGELENDCKTLAGIQERHAKQAGR